MHLIISGHVQGVGFRYFTQRKGRKLGLTGQVRNLQGGQVEAILQGAKESIETLVQILRRGPPLSSVEDIQLRLVESAIHMKEFKIEEDGVEQWEIS